MTGVTAKLLGSEAGSHSSTPFVLSLLMGELLERETKPESWLLGGENTGKWERQREKSVLKVSSLCTFSFQLGSNKERGTLHFYFQGKCFYWHSLKSQALFLFNNRISVQYYLFNCREKLTSRVPVLCSLKKNHTKQKSIPLSWGKLFPPFTKPLLYVKDANRTCLVKWSIWQITPSKTPPMYFHHLTGNPSFQYIACEGDSVSTFLWR